MSTPTPAQARAADPSISAWVEANAGSGKTRVLVDRVRRLLLSGVNPRSILCLTFTRAAASEMQKRLFDLLGGWCTAPESVLRRELRALGGKAMSESDPTRIRALFAGALEAPGGLRIQTLHSFCLRLLRQFPLEAGIAPGFQELDATEAARLRARAFEALARRCRDDPALVAAVDEASRLFGSATNLYRTLEITIGDGQTLLDRVEKLGGIDAAEGTLRKDLGAIDGGRAELLRAHFSAIPGHEMAEWARMLEDGGATDRRAASELATMLREKDDEARWRAAERLFLTRGGEPRKQIVTRKMLTARPALSRLVEAAGEQDRFLATLEKLRLDTCRRRSVALLRVGVHLAAQEAEAKRAQGALSYADLIRLGGMLLRSSEAREWVRWKLDPEVAHILVDEAQDNSEQQWQLVRTLTEELFAGAAAPGARSVFAVGDTKQSIYGFQGAEPTLFAGEGKRAQEAAQRAKIAFERVDLGTSFRSTAPVLTFVDEVFDQSGQDFPTWLRGTPGLADFPKHEPARVDAPGLVELWRVDQLDRQARTDADFAAGREYMMARNSHAQLATKIAAHLRSALDRGEGITDPENGATRPLRPGDILILVRGRVSGLYDALLFALQREGLPIAGADRICLLESAAVQDVLNLVRLALFADDDLVLAELLAGPFCRLDYDRDLFALAHDRGRESLRSRLRQSEAPHHREARAFVDAVLEARALPPFEFLSRVLEIPAAGGETGRDALLRAFGEPARLPLDALIERALRASGPAGASLQAFLAEIESETGEVQRNPASVGERIQIMTVHGAKGGQAPFVVLPDCGSDPGAPGRMQTGPSGMPVHLARPAEQSVAERQLHDAAKTRETQEHFRVLYVALTRARDRLLICAPARIAQVNERSWFSRCRAAMESLVRKDLAEYESGVWRLGTPPQAVGAPCKASPDAELPAWIGAAADAVPPPRRPEAEPARGTRRFESAARRRGVLVHALLERLPEVAPEQRMAAARRILAAERGLPSSQAEEIAAAASAVLDDPGSAWMFGPDSRAEVALRGRWPGLPGPEGEIRARIDRLVVPDSGRVVFLDYKTGADVPATPERTPADVLRQMATYRHLLRGIFPNRNVACFLLWTSGPTRMEIPDTLLDRHQACARRAAVS